MGKKVLSLFFISFFACQYIAAQSADSYYKKGVQYLKNKEYSAAIENFTKAIALKPDYEPYYLKRADAEYMEEKYTEAISDFTKCISLKNDDYKMYYNRAMACKLDRDTASAISDLTTCVKIKPDYRPAYNKLGEIYYARHIYDSSYYHFSKLYELDTNDNKALINRANAAKKQGKIKDALSYLNHIILVHPENQQAYYNRGVLFVDLGRFNDAIDDFNKAIKLDPNDGDAYCALGVVYNNTLKVREACQLWRKAANLGSKEGAKNFNQRCRTLRDIDN